MTKKLKTKDFEEIKKFYPRIELKSTHNTLDLTNKRFGHLVCIYPTIVNKRRAWVCKCDCGNYTAYPTDNLTCQGIVTCGPACPYKKRKTHELLGQKFGRLTVIEKVGPNKFGYMQWKCKCDCGNETIVIGKYLEAGKTLSCGSCPDLLKSKGNHFITNWLVEHNISFKSEVRFDDCRAKYPLPFDFVIYDSNNKIKCCIEYQGNLHYKATGGWITEEYVSEVQERDMIKKCYCEQHDIKLVCIPYTEYNNLDAILIKECDLDD